MHPLVGMGPTFSFHDGIKVTLTVVTVYLFVLF